MSSVTKQRMLPANFTLLDLNDRRVANLGQVTSLDIFDGSTTVFHEDGLYSTKIFGRVGSNEREARVGYIDLKVSILHPKIARDLFRLKGLYREIVAGRTKAMWSVKDKDFINVKPQHLQEQLKVPGNEYGTGYAFFMRYFPKIEFRETSSTERQDRIDFINKYRHRPTIRRIAVIPAAYRDLQISEDGRITKDEINDLYYSCLSISNVINDKQDLDDPLFDVIRNSLTNRVMEIYTLLETMLQGKRGLMLSDWGSRTVDHGTRNVLSVADHTRDNLITGRGPDTNSVTVGLWQTIKGLTPFTIYALRNTILKPIFGRPDTLVPLIDPKTLETVETEIHPTTKERWTSKEGLLKVINSFSYKEARHNPVMVEGKYLLLVYSDDKSFKIVYDLNDVPDHIDRSKIKPMTYAEMFYLIAYRRWYEFYGLMTRYPVTGIDSIFPAKIYLKTTAVGSSKYELQDDWSFVKDPERLALEYPDITVPLFHDTLSASTNRLTGLGADFDGDVGSLTYIMDSGAIAKIKSFLSSRQAWIAPNGAMRASMGYDTTNFVLSYLTGEPEARP